MLETQTTTYLSDGIFVCDLPFPAAVLFLFLSFLLLFISFPLLYFFFPLLFIFFLSLFFLFLFFSSFPFLLSSLFNLFSSCFIFSYSFLLFSNLLSSSFPPPFYLFSSSFNAQKRKYNTLALLLRGMT